MQLRLICTCARLQSYRCSKSNVKISKTQIGNIVNKVINFDCTKKNAKKPVSAHSSLPIPHNHGATTKSATTHRSRRVMVLNKVFMKHITDLMATGEVAPKLLGRGIEISHVKVSPDFLVVDVYWFAHKVENEDESTEDILRQTAGHLQHALSQLRVIGIVPPIRFVKNTFFSLTKEVENRLTKVDFGEDYVPSTYIMITNKVPVLQTSLSSKVKDQLLEVDCQSNEDEETYEIDVPEMRQDVLGFDHSYIMKKIKFSLSKTRMAERNRILQVPEEPVGSQQISPDVASFLSNKEETALFDEFIKKRMIDEKRKLSSKPLKEVKLEEEEEWFEKMTHDIFDDIKIEEESRDEYYEIEKYK